MTDQEAEALWQGVFLGEEHDRTAALLVYADAVEELGETAEAQAWRWLAWAGRWPEEVEEDADFGGVAWAWRASSSPHDSSRPAALRWDLFDRLPTPAATAPTTSTRCDTTRSALDRALQDAAAAFVVAAPARPGGSTCEACGHPGNYGPSHSDSPPRHWRQHPRHEVGLVHEARQPLGGGQPRLVAHPRPGHSASSP